MIIQWNCNGFYNHLAELQILKQQTNPDYICLQETHLKTDQKAKLNGYTSYNKNRDHQHASGGVSILIKNCHHYEEIPINTNLEVQVLKVYYPQEIYICNIYLPPNQNINKEVMKDLILQIPTPYLILGDFNAHNPIWGAPTLNPRGKIIEELTENDILLNDDTPTHYCARSGTFSTIDLSFAHPNIAPSLNWHSLQPIYGSDHAPITIKHINNIPNEVDDTKIKWKLETANWTHYQNQMNIPSNNDTTNINEMVEEFTKKIRNAAKAAIEVNENRTQQKKKTCWWNTACKEAIKKQKQALYLLRKNNSVENQINFKKQRAKTRYIIKKSKKESWQEFVSQINPNTPSTDVWNKIRKIKHSKIVSETSTIIKGQQIITDPKSIAEELAQAFEINASNKKYSEEFLKHKIETESNHITNNIHNNNIINHKITLHEIKLAISKLKTNTSPGPDQIVNEMIKKLPEEAVKHIQKIYNQIWTLNQFPNKWKMVNIIPILKPGKNKTETTSYRPIALSNTLCKLMEKIINKRLMWHLESENILISEQSGFRKNRSTIDHLITLKNEIDTAYRNKQHLVAIAFDIEKAFETTWRYNIVKTAKEIGLEGNILNFINNFLQDRKFRVKTNGKLSETKNQENGIPQGSIISPTLFLIVMNKIKQSILGQVKFMIFADDLIIYIRDKNIKTIENELQKTVNKLDNWAKENGFIFSTTKTNIIDFCKLKKHTYLNIKLQNKTIEQVTHIKFLGMYFDHRMTWKIHISNLRKECHKRINLLKILSHQKWGADKEMLLKIYRTLIRSKLDYGCIIYSSAKKYLLSQIDAIHNMGIRIASGAFKTSPVSSLLCEASEPPLDLRRKQFTLKYTIKLSTNPKNPTYPHIFQSIMDDTGTIHLSAANNTQLQKYITEIRKDTNLNIPSINIQQKTFTTYPPWNISRPVLNTELSGYRKETTPINVYLKRFQEFTNEIYRYHTWIYTDGSKSKEGVGAATVTAEEEHYYHLPDNFSIYSAEKYALLQALQNIKKNPTNNQYVICTDSLSVIQELQNPYSACTLSQNIFDTIHNLNPVKIIILWIPSHIGIEGNEKADVAAKRATKEIITNIPIPTFDLLAKIKPSIKTKWETMWKNEPRTNKLRQIKNTTNTWTNQKIRKQQVILTRLRIGHSQITHKYLYEKENPPQCDLCNEQLTIDHIITKCTKYLDERRANNIPNNIIEALQNKKDKEDNIISFLHEIKLYISI